MAIVREGSLAAPTRHPLDWRSDDFYNEQSLNAELERVFDACHGCRRCVNLCQAFPTLFDLVDESETMEIDGVATSEYGKVVDHCYLCDLCYMTKCPYVPPHEWAIDFPHLMLRAKAVKHRRGETKTRDKVITSTDAIGRFASIPVVVNAVNAANRTPMLRNVLDSTFGIHADANLPTYASPTLRQRLRDRVTSVDNIQPAGRTTGKVALFATCYGNFNEPHLGEDLIAVFEHNGIPVTIAQDEQCCGMPKLELGDLSAVERAKDANIPTLIELIDAGWDIIAPVPSCVLMFKQELPLMFPDDDDVQRVRAAMFDPFEYLAIRNKAGCFKTDFKTTLGAIAYQVACHQRVQNIGPKTAEILSLIPDTDIKTIERCSGHDGTYAVKSETYAAAQKIVRPVARQAQAHNAEHITSDCPMAASHVAHASGHAQASHPITLLRQAYGI